MLSPLSRMRLVAARLRRDAVPRFFEGTEGGDPNLRSLSRATIRPPFPHNIVPARARESVRGIARCAERAGHRLEVVNLDSLEKE